MADENNVSYHLCVMLAIGAIVEGRMTILVSEDSKGYRGVLAKYEKNIQPNTRLDEKYYRAAAASIFKKHNIDIQGEEAWLLAQPKKGTQDFGDSSIETAYMPVVIQGKYSKAIKLPPQGFKWMPVEEARSGCSCNPAIWFILADVADKYKMQLVE